MKPTDIAKVQKIESKAKSETNIYNVVMTSTDNRMTISFDIPLDNNWHLRLGEEKNEL